MRALLDHELLTLREAQQLMHISRCEINEMIDTGKLKTIKVGSRWKIEGWQLKNLMTLACQKDDVNEFDDDNNFVNVSNYELSMIADWT